MGIGGHHVLEDICAWFFYTGLFKVGISFAFWYIKSQNIIYGCIEDENNVSDMIHCGIVTCNPS